MEDVVDGARLLALGMRPKLIPSRDLIYAELVKRFAEDGPFRELTEAIAEGLGLKVLAVSSRTGVVLGPAESSVFEQKFDDYARRTVLGERRDLERVLHGIAHLAIAALAFLRPDDLATDTYVGRVSVEQADSVVREACTCGALTGRGFGWVAGQRHLQDGVLSQFKLDVLGDEGPHRAREDSVFGFEYVQCFAHGGQRHAELVS